MSRKPLLDEVISVTQSVPSAPCIGRLAGTNTQRDVLVVYEGKGPLTAKLIAGIDRYELIKDENRSREVLIVFEKGDPSRPVIVGLMEDPLESMVSFNLSPKEAPDLKGVLVDGKRVTIEAADEIMLKCGRGSILIRKDGKIVIKGTDLLSRSSGRHRVKGASVNIN
jgi:hypothetical protein